MFSNAKVGDKVWDFTLGYGKISMIDDSSQYSIVVSDFETNGDVSYTKDGTKLCLKYIEDLESRTCESCKYWGYSQDVAHYEDCMFGLIDHSYAPNSFGCNKWEPKND